MLTGEERRLIEAILPLYETKAAAAVESMRVLQDSRGWVSDEALADLVELLEVSAEELDSLATFYSMIFRQPVGRHVIMVCSSVCCWILGYEEIVGYLRERLGVELGGTSSDGRFTCSLSSASGPATKRRRCWSTGGHTAISPRTRSTPSWRPTHETTLRYRFSP